MTVLTPPSPPPSPSPSSRLSSPLPTLRIGQDPNHGAAHSGAGQTAGPGGAGQTAGPGDLTAGRPVSAVVVELALIALALSASLGVARLIQGGLGHAVAVPVVLTVLAGGLVTAVSARKGLPLVVAAALGAVASGLAVLWTVVPGATRFGFPTITSVHVVSNEIQRARAVMGSHRTPVPDVSGVVIIASFASGAVSVAARTLFELSRRRARGWPKLLALVPTFGMFCYSAPLSARIDRPQFTILYLASAMFFVAAADSGNLSLLPSGPYRRLRRVLSTHLPSVAAAGAALVVVVMAAGALAGTVPVAFPWWNQSPGTGTGSGKGGAHRGVTALSLIANLQGDETTSANVQMFQATSPVPTYWQVGLLTVFEGAKWGPGPAETAALDGTGVLTPPIPELPSVSNTFIANVTIQDFSGRLLPAPPLAILPTVNSPVQLIRIVDGIGAAVSAPLGSGKSYQIIAASTAVPSLSSGPSSLEDIYAGLGDAGPEYLQLPAGIPAEVRTIARQVVAGARNPLEQVQALVNYFHSDLFAYTLDPPPVPKGENALLAFLTTNRFGFCQQFAGAFGVLARELGLPVRLAVGFTPGRTVQKGGDEYQVTGSDAHVWPEVYMGPGLGWISVDPTPSPANGEQTASGVVNYRPFGGGKGNGHHSTATSLPKAKNKIPLPQNPNTSPAGTTHRARGSGPLPAGLIVAGVVVATLVGLGLILLRRQRRSVGFSGTFSKGSSDPDHVVLRAWFRASDALGRAGFRRPQWETPATHAAEVRAAVIDGAPGAKRADSAAALGAATYGYTELAHLAELACYCPGRCTSRDARHAEQEAWRIERALRSSGMFRRFPGPPVAGPLGAVGSTGSVMSAGSFGSPGSTRSTATLTVVGSETASKQDGSSGVGSSFRAPR